MERREFLKILGLSGVALTMPKPLGIVSAKMADLHGPPLHVGYAEIRPVGFPSEQFVERAYGITIENGLPACRYEDYLRNWQVRFFLRKGEDTSSRVLWLQGPARMIQDPEINLVHYSFGRDGHHIEIPTLLSGPLRRLWTREDVGELWLLPSDRNRLPQYALPKLKWLARGMMLYPDQRMSREWWSITDVQTVQVDREKAIQIGLCDASEPEGIIV